MHFIRYVVKAISVGTWPKLTEICQPMDEVMYYPSQASLVSTHRPKGLEDLVTRVDPNQKH